MRRSYWKVIRFIELLNFISETMMVTLLGALGGIVLGLAARLSRFCTLGAIEDAIYGRDLKLIRMWFLAIGCAIFVVGLATIPGWVFIHNSVYWKMPFSPILTIIGGVLFGLGMAFSGNCGFGSLSRLGGGDLKSFVIVLVMGIAAYTMSSGVLSPLTIFLREILTISETTPSLLDIFINFVPISYTSLSCLIGVSLILVSISDRNFRRSGNHVFWGIMVGFAISSGWIGMNLISQYGFEDLEPVSHSFTAPIGTLILYSMTSLGGSNFALGSVVGVWSGALLGSLIKGHFRLEGCEDPRELQRQIVGAIMMGFGAIFALGCSVGQGLSAMAVLSLNAPIAIISIFIGARFGLQYLITGRFLFKSFR